MNRFLEIDKAMSLKIQKELEGKEWQVDCDNCMGKGFWPTPYFKVKKRKFCKNCNGTGKYMMTV